MAYKDKEKNKAFQKQYQAKHGRKYHLLSAYNMSLEEYDRLFEEQKGVCAICSAQPTTKRLHVDHSHVTGKNRGLLCDNCNWLLGCARDSIEMLQKSIRYLEKYS